MLRLVDKSVRWPTEIFEKLLDATGEIITYFSRYALIRFGLEKGLLEPNACPLLPWIVRLIYIDGDEVLDFQLSE